MSRTLRVQFPGAIYHVTSRGSRRDDIFLDDMDRGQFWQRLGEAVVRYRWEMYAAVLMSNHFHLFFRTRHANLSRGMQFLLGGYASWFNRRHQRLGHVFQGRFRGHVIEDESYFWTVSRYVHRNPVPVLVAHPSDWPWSTYAGYVNVERRWHWVAYDALLHAWQGTFGAPDAVSRYLSFVEADLAERPRSPFDAAIDGWILGSQEFAEQIRERLQPAGRRLARATAPLIDIHQLLEITCEHYGISPQQLAQRSSRHPGRSVLALLAQRHAGLTLNQIAPLLGLDRADCVPYLLKRAATAEDNSALALAIQQIEQRLSLSSSDGRTGVITQHWH